VLISLDCQTYNSVVQSISQLFEITVSQIENFLTNLDLDEYFEKYEPTDSPDDVLFMLFKKNLSKLKREIEKIYWFHLTSTPINTDFKEGLLPLTSSINLVWDKLESILTDTSHYENIIKLRKNGVPSRHFTIKTKNHMFSGPYAILIRDCAFELDHKKYLQMPEIVEDILEGYKITYGIDIRNLVEKSFKPCIVKFWSKKRIDLYCIKTALYYLYTVLKGNKFSIHTNTCYDGYNEKIIYEQIEKVEYLNI